ncbi:hypothetical protein NC651_005884 [Populus alba x Populus x berolinensis]|nr:hypothetical protein NC651_005884 [Populus alba x Populus x berolinensis]
MEWDVQVLVAEGWESFCRWLVSGISQDQSYVEHFRHLVPKRNAGIVNELVDLQFIPVMSWLCNGKSISRHQAQSARNNAIFPLVQLPVSRPNACIETTYNPPEMLTDAQVSGGSTMVGW